MIVAEELAIIRMTMISRTPSPRVRVAVVEPVAVEEGVEEASLRATGSHPVAPPPRLGLVPEEEKEAGVAARAKAGEKAAKEREQEVIHQLAALTVR